MAATGPPGLSAEQIKRLSAPLNREHVRSRSQSGQTLSYIEGWHAIAEANRIFGFDGWHRETLDVRCVSERERLIGRQQKPGWGVTYTARVRVTVGTIIRDGCGAGHGIDVDPGQAHESAIKEAETDAMKRALMTWGNPFGLALYDKQQTEVADPPPPPAPAALVAAASKRFADAGVTSSGVLAFVSEQTNGDSTVIGDLPAELLERVVRAGLSPTTRDRLNAAGEAMTTATDNEPPGRWAVPTTTTTAAAA